MKKLALFFALEFAILLGAAVVLTVNAHHAQAATACTSAHC